MKLDVCLAVFALFALSARADYFASIPCRDSQNCANVLTPQMKAICLSGICMCPNLATKVYEVCSNRNMIVGSRFGGEDRRCSNDRDCVGIEGSKCFRPENDSSKRGICDCHPKMLMSADNRRCLPVVTELIGPCTESSQCSEGLKGAECYNGVCRCKAKFHFATSKRQCILNKAYGEQCTREEESCYQEAGLHNVNALGCSDKNVCKCRRNFQLVDGLCQSSGAKRTAIQILLVVVSLIFSMSMF